MRSSLKFSSRRSLPLVLQAEAAECGLACLAMVAGYHGYRTDLTSLRGHHPLSLKGSTLAQLMEIALRMQLAPRAVRVDLDELKRLDLPAILHWDFNHFVVVERVHRGHVFIHDPARGTRRLSLAEASKHFTGVALELAPTEAFEPRVERRNVALRDLVGRLPGARGAMAQILVLAAALEVFAIASPLFMQLVVDDALVGGDRHFLVVLGMGFLLLAIVHTGVSALRAWVVMTLSTGLSLRMADRLFRHLLKLPMRFFEKRHLGDIASRFESLQAIQSGLTSNLIEAIVDGLMAVITLGMMLVYSWRLTAVVCAAVVLYAALRWALFRPLRQAQEEQIAHAARQQTYFLETLRGMQSVKLFRRETQRSVAHQNLLVDNINADIRTQKLEILYEGANGGLFSIENVAVVWLGALAVLNGGFSVGMLFAFMAYKQQFSERVSSLIENAIELKMLGLHTERVADIALTAPEAESSMSSRRETEAAAGIEVRGVSFRYSESEPLVLENVSFEIDAGKSVAIIGPSGCGKTTLLKLILGLLTPVEGEIRVGGVDISALGPGYRDMIGTVMQEDQLFAGSIADNISFFDPTPDHARIETCAERAAVHEDVSAMPMAYNTLIGDMGTVLSGGQKQRVLLARALYKAPAILVLDEATSHLDTAREQRVNQAVSQLALTRLIVAHRPETYASADRVIELDAKGLVPTPTSIIDRASGIAPNCRA